MTYSIFDHPSVKRVSVFALLWEGSLAGRIIIAYPNDGAGIVRAGIGAWQGPLKEYDMMNGNAGGYGYHKSSAAIQNALDRAKVPSVPDFGGRGDSAVTSYFQSLGYQIESIL